MMFRRISRILALTVALLLLPAAAGAEVRIGLAIPVTGPYAASGERNRVAVQLAIAALNQAGGVLGQQVKLVVVDDGCDAERAADAALELVKAGVGFVVGHMCSHASLIAAPIYEAAGLPMMSPNSTHPAAHRGRPRQCLPASRQRRHPGPARRRLAGAPTSATAGSRSSTTEAPTAGALPSRRGRACARTMSGEALFASYEPGQDGFQRAGRGVATCGDRRAVRRRLRADAGRRSGPPGIVAAESSWSAVTGWAWRSSGRRLGTRARGPCLRRGRT